MTTFVNVVAVARDAEWRLKRVAIFFEVLFAAAIVGAIALDMIPAAASHRLPSPPRADAVALSASVRRRAARRVDDVRLALRWPRAGFQGA